MRPCRFFQHGNCWKGEACSFSHSSGGDTGRYFGGNWRSSFDGNGTGPSYNSTGKWRSSFSQSGGGDTDRNLEGDRRSSFSGDYAGRNSDGKWRRSSFSRNGGGGPDRNLEGDWRKASSDQTKPDASTAGTTWRAPERIARKPAPDAKNIFSDIGINRKAEPTGWGRPTSKHAVSNPKEPAIERVMGNTLSVTFGPGLEVTKLASASVTSIVVIHNLPPNTSAGAVIGLLALIDPDLDPGTVHAIPIEDATCATAKLSDSAFVAEVVRRIDGTSYEGYTLSVQRYHPENRKNLVQSPTRVRCNWSAPSKSVSVTFPDHGTATRQALAAKGKRVRGREPEWKIPSHGEMPSGVITVMIRNLAIDTTEKDLRRLVPLGFTSVDFHEPTYDLKPKEAMEYIVRLFAQQSHDIDGYGLISSQDSQKAVAYIEFDSARAAEEVAEEYDCERQDFLGGSPLFLEVVHTANFRILPEIHSFVRKELDFLTREQKDNARIEVFTSRTLITIRITTDDRRKLSTVKRMIGNLVRGELCLEMPGGEPLWDPFFATKEGIREIQRTGETTRTYIFHEKRSSQLFLFGTREERRRASERLRERLIALVRKGQAVAIEGPRQWKYIMRGGLQVLRGHFGDFFEIDIVKRTLIYTKADGVGHNEAQIELDRVATDGDGNLDERDTRAACPICFELASMESGTLELPKIFSLDSECTHVYEAPCLRRYLNYIASAQTFPITCVGEGIDGILCGCPFDISVLPAVLSPQELDAILDSAFRDEISRRSDEFAYCPTRTCSTVYRRSFDKSEGAVFTCAECLLEICTRCNVEAHFGVSCREFRAERMEEKTEMEFEMEFEVWKQRNGAHRCPVCGYHVQRTWGCDFLTCGGCETHICWVCLTLFREAEAISTHMKLNHDNNS